MIYGDVSLGSRGADGPASQPWEYEDLYRQEKNRLYTARRYGIGIRRVERGTPTSSYVNRQSRPWQREHSQ